MHLIVGLGNPGEAYDGTRHNVGFDVIDELARRGGFGAFRRFKNGEVAKGSLGTHDVVLVKPMTFMNLSGDCVQAVMAYYKLTPADLIIVHDELDFEVGVVRVKQGGGHGGHNGLRSIMGHVGPDFVRVRVGVGKPPSSAAGASHVLSKFTVQERGEIGEAVVVASDAVVEIVSQGVAAAMGRFNRRPT